MTCCDCGATFDIDALPDHFRDVHARELPDFERWPDGGVVFYEDDPSPSDVTP